MTDAENIDWDIMKIADWKYEKRRARHGMSWLNMPIGSLEIKLEEEINEWMETTSREDSINELADIINVCRMIGQRHLEGMTTEWKKAAWRDIF